MIDKSLIPDPDKFSMDYISGYQTYVDSLFDFPLHYKILEVFGDGASMYEIRDFMDMYNEVYINQP